MKNVGIVLFSLMILFSGKAAQANVSIVGGIDYNMDSYSATATIGSVTASSSIKGGLGFAGGLLVGLGSLETGAVFLSKSYTTSATGQASVSSSSTAVHIPVMYRFGQGVSFGVGGFLDASSSSNYGLTIGPRFGGAAGGLFLDVRYNHSIKTNGSKDILALVGFAFGGKK